MTRSNVNWSSSLLNHSITYHDFYTNTYLGFTSDARNMSGCPQYVLDVTNPTSQKVPAYVMVSRHYTNYDDLLGNDKYKILFSLQVYETERPQLMVKQSDAKTILSSEIVYTNIPYDMCRILVEPGHHVYSVVLQTLKKDARNLHSFGFTLQTRFNSIISGFVQPINEYAQYHFNCRVAGKWEGSNAGGRSSLESFANNPMYAIRVTRPTFVHTRLEVVGDSGLSVYLRLLRRKDVEERHLTQHYMVLGSDAFTSGACLLQGELEPGEYVLIAATYNAGERGRYVITTRSSLPLEMKAVQDKPIPLPMLGDDLPFAYNIISFIRACAAGESVLGPTGFRRAH